MSEIQITEKDIGNKELDILGIILLKIIFYKEEGLFQSYKENIFGWRANVANLQDFDYIKILGCENLDQLVIRPKCEEFFKKETSEFREIINYLNIKIGKKKGFSLTSAANKRIINARLKEYSVQDLKDVVDVMWSKWKGSQMEFYMRPETLFNETKFQGYYALSEKKSNTSNIFTSTV